MRQTRQISRGSRRVSIRVLWFRLQSRIASFYAHRVTQPCHWWRAAGCPSQFRPSLPWWQPLAYRWLVLTGWLEPRRRR